MGAEMTNITTNDPGRTLPPKLAEFGESLLRIADRAREVQGLEPFGEDMHVFMRAVTSAFAGADDRGSVCVRLFDVARRMGLEVGEDEEAYDADIRAHLEELARWGLAAAGAPAEGARPLAPLVLDEGAGGLAFAEEQRLAAALVRIASKPPRTLPEATAALVERLTGALHADELQTKAVRLALENRLAVISGGPGTGKTTTVVLILECLLEENKDLSIYLAAPTGKATSRMRQSIVAMTQGPRRVEEHTIHKWLVKKTPSGEKPTADNPLPADVLIIDEASMVDIHLAARLFEVVSESTRVIILGDKHQLAAVGPGAVFADISATDGALAASTVELKTSRRFAEGSVIAKLAAAINHDGGISSSTARTTVKRLLADAQTGGDPDWRIAWDDAMPQGEGGYGLAPAATAWLEERFSRYTAALVDYMRVVTRPEPKAAPSGRSSRPSGRCAPSAAARRASRASTPGPRPRSGRRSPAQTSKPSPRTAGTIPAVPSSSEATTTSSASSTATSASCSPTSTATCAPSSSTPTAACRPRSCPRTTRPSP